MDTVDDIYAIYKKNYNITMLANKYISSLLYNSYNIFMKIYTFTNGTWVNPIYGYCGLNNIKTESGNIIFDFNTNKHGISKKDDNHIVIMSTTSYLLYNPYSSVVNRAFCMFD